MVEMAGDAAALRRPDSGLKDNGGNIENAARAALLKEALLLDVAPESRMQRYGLVTVKGLESLPSGVWHAIKEDWNHPMEVVKTVATSAAMGAVLKTVMPESGPTALVAGLAIGGYFTYKALGPVLDAYGRAGRAVTMKEIDLAGQQIGDAGGSFIVNSAIAGVGYKLGAGVADRVLMSERFDAFADAKARFYGTTDKGIMNSYEFLRQRSGLGSPASSEIFQPRSFNGKTELASSNRAQPPAEAVLQGVTNPGEQMNATVLLKSKATDVKVNRMLRRISEGQRGPLGELEFAEKFGADPKALEQVTKFASDHGLTVAEADLASGRVLLTGSASQFGDAFNVKLQNYQHSSGEIFRGRTGRVMVPNELLSQIEGVFGLDQRPQARPLYVRPGKPAPGPTIRGDGAAGPAEPPAARSGGYLPNEVAEMYNFPKNTTGKGQGVAIVELGGGLNEADNAAYYKLHGLKQPKIKIVGVDGAKNSPGNPNGADGEVALDSQVVGAVAPDAEQLLIFGPNSDQGFVDTVTRGIFTKKGEAPTAAVSISWGAPESSWTQQGINAMNRRFKDAALKGVSVFAASGDAGAMDQAKTFQTDYPASDPYVTGTGGTRLTGKGGKIQSEVAWNDAKDSSGGGGVSEKFPVPDYQNGLNLPKNLNSGLSGRGVPDIAGNASPATGYLIRVGGAESAIGGTSAVSPLYSALIARVNEGLAGGQAGFLNPFLYKNGLNPTIFNDITRGNNNGYETGRGWDAVTGWGSINGQGLLDALRAEQASRQGSALMALVRSTDWLARPSTPALLVGKRGA